MPTTIIPKSQHSKLSEQRETIQRWIQTKKVQAYANERNAGKVWIIDLYRKALSHE